MGVVVGIRSCLGRWMGMSSRSCLQTLIEFPGFEIVIFLARTCSKGSIVTLIVVIPGNG